MSTILAAAVQDPVVTESRRLAARAARLIPGESQTLAKGPTQLVRGFAPQFLARGKGARVWDVDGNEYLDLTMAVGPLVLGYGWPAVDAAIERQLRDGITFSLVHPLEVEVAEAIQEVVPWAESFRYSKTGADAVSAAVRLARAFTGRDKVVCCGYHGWHDWYVAGTDKARGVPPAVRALTETVDYDDLAAVAGALDDETACVVLEPVVFQAPRPGYLENLQALCRDNGSLLVFDEMWTGFRIALGGAAEWFGVTPDLATYSKAVANGMPLSVVAGRRDVMSLAGADVWFYTTFGGEALSLAAAKATLSELREHDVPKALARSGRRIRDGYEDVAAALGIRWTRCVGLDARTMVTFDPAAGDALLLKSLLQQELLRRGVLWGGCHNVSFSHGEAEVDALLAAYEGALPVLKEAVETNTVRERLKGAPIEPSFRRVSGFGRKKGA